MSDHPEIPPSQDLVRLITNEVVSAAEFNDACLRNLGALVVATGRTADELSKDEQTALGQLATSLAERQLAPLGTVDDETYNNYIQVRLAADRAPASVVNAFVALTGANKLTAKDLAGYSEQIARMGREEAVMAAVTEEIVDALMASGKVEPSDLEDFNTAMFISGAIELHCSLLLNIGDESLWLTLDQIIQAVRDLAGQSGVSKAVLEVVVTKLREYSN